MCFRVMPRMKAPKWKAPAVVGDVTKEISLDEYKGKYLCMLFYPLDFTFVCPTELIAFSDNIEKFRERGAEVVAVSVDSTFTHLAWKKTPRSQGGVGDLKIPMISDINKKIGRDYGVIVDDENDALNGIHLRGLYIISDNQVIRSVQINDAPVGRSVEETLRLIDAFKHTDEHGEACPVDWKKGDEAIIPDPENKKKYFESKYKEDL